MNTYRQTSRNASTDLRAIFHQHPVWFLATLLALLLVMVAWSAPNSGGPQSFHEGGLPRLVVFTVTPSPELAPSPAGPILTPTYSAEVESPHTDGIILGAIFLVLIIIGGTLSTTRRKPG